MTKPVRMEFRVEADTKKRFVEILKQSGTSVSSWVRKRIEEFISERK